jgi:hypothetical protein
VEITVGRESVAADEQADHEGEKQGAEEKVFTLHEI